MRCLSLTRARLLSGTQRLRAPELILLPGGWPGQESSIFGGLSSPLPTAKHTGKGGGLSPLPFPVGFAVGGGLSAPQQINDSAARQLPGIRISVGAFRMFGTRDRLEFNSGQIAFRYPEIESSRTSPSPGGLAGPGIVHFWGSKQPPSYRKTSYRKTQHKNE